MGTGEKKKLKKFKTKAEFEAVPEGWYYNPTERNGVVFIKTKKIAVSNKFKVNIAF